MRGLVYKSTGSWYTVRNEKGAYYECRIKGRFRIDGIKSTNPVAVGDWVHFEIETKGDETIGIIDRIEPRDNYIVRRSVNLSKQTHIIAANIDIAFLLVTLKNPVTFPAFIDRFLVTAQAYDIQAVLLFNKWDSYTADELDEVKYLAHIYRQIGYTCIGISAKTGHNLEKVRALMENKVCMFSGHSGVGKSTLVNALEPGLDLKTSEISEQHLQGQHTTTFAQMYDTTFGARIIDTPGIRGFGVVEMDKDEIGDYFPEFFALKQDCKFNNCHHINEPKCAVKQALDEGLVAWSRYKSYLQLMEDKEDSYR